MTKIGGHKFFKCIKCGAFLNSEDLRDQHFEKVHGITKSSKKLEQENIKSDTREKHGEREKPKPASKKVRGEETNFKLESFEKEGKKKKKKPIISGKKKKRIISNESLGENEPKEELEEESKESLQATVNATSPQSSTSKKSRRSGPKNKQQKKKKTPRSILNESANLEGNENPIEHEASIDKEETRKVGKKSKKVEESVEEIIKDVSKNKRKRRKVKEIPKEEDVCMESKKADKVKDEGVDGSFVEGNKTPESEINASLKTPAIEPTSIGLDSDYGSDRTTYLCGSTRPDPSAALSHNEVALVLQAFKSPPVNSTKPSKIPKSETQEQHNVNSTKPCNLPKSEAQEQHNEVTITPVEDGKLEIEYIGLQENVEDNGGKAKFSDWRRETIKALPKKGQAKRSCSKYTSIKIPSTSPHMFSIRSMKDDLHSILDALTGQELSTEVLDAYLSSTVIKHNAQVNAGVRAEYKLRPNMATNFEYLSVHFLPIFEKDQVNKELYPNVKYLPETNLINSVLIAPLYTCKHYYLAIFDFPKKTISVYDSSWQFVNRDVRFHHVNSILKILTNKGMDFHSLDEWKLLLQNWSVDFKLNCAQQLDEKSCGYFVINFVKNILIGKTKKCNDSITTNRLLQIRHEIVGELLPTTKRGRQFLDAISC